MVIPSLSICSGIGGLDLGIHAADPRIRTVCYVERQAFAASVLVARMAESKLDKAPIWDDLTTFPCAMFRGKVGVIIGGVPCQPWSTIGPKTGINDSRDLWPHMLRITQEIGAGAIFLENVSGFKSNPNGLARVLGEVAEMGWDAQWGMFSNQSLGAPHRRERIFVLAYSSSFANYAAWDHEETGRDEFANGCGYVRHPNRFARREEESRGNQRNGQETRWDQSDNRSCESSQEFSNAESSRLPIPRTRPLESLGTRTLRSGFWPAGNDPEQWGGVHPKHWPATVKLPFRGEANGLPDWLVKSNTNRVDRLFCLGNAVSPPVAAVAWRELIRRMGLAK